MLKYLFILICLSTINCENIVCPSQCICDMTNGLRSARCNNAMLPNVEVDIPPEVQYVDLSNNVISNLGDYIFQEINLNDLIALNISNNMISVISLRAFVGLKYLQIIDLSNNRLNTIIPDVFRTNDNLKKLFLSGNKFNSLQNEPFLESESLEVIDISRCLISNIYPEFFLKLPNLYAIDISQNFLIQLDIPTFQTLTKLKLINIYDNKINCNSKTEELLQYFQKNQILHDNICQKVEKSQKMIILDEPVLKDDITNWNFDICDIETHENKPETKQENCQIIYENNLMSWFLFFIVFTCGLLIGVSITCCFVNCAYFIKKRQKRRFNTNVRNRRPYVNRRPIREELLLTENSYNIGLSTPVLPRARPPVIK